MKVGMNLLLWTVQPTMKAHGRLIERIKQWGFDGVEFPVWAMTNDDIQAFAKQTDDLGLERTTITSLDATQADPASNDPKLRQAAVDALKGAIDQTRDIGSDILTGPVFQGLGRFTGKAPTRQEWEWAVETIRQAAEHAAKMHIRLAIEPLNRFEMYMVNTVADGARFCRDVGMPNVGLLADTHHANIEEEQPAKAWAKQVKHIYHVHISENNRGVPGRGHAVTPDIFDALQQGGYSDWVTIEAFSTKVEALVPRLHIWRPFFDREEDVAVEGLHYIRQQLKRVGA